MKTVVFQSYRTERVPDWIAACMASVRSWASASGFEYRFIDDSLFDFAPAWYRERCGGEICPVADLARLVLARELLASGYERTIWVDADVLAFDPASLKVDTSSAYAFCLELWPAVDAQGQLRFEYHVNNAISMFTRENRQVDFLIDACLQIARHRSPIGKLDMSTKLLSALATVMPMPLLSNVGMFSPLVMRAIADGDERLIREYATHLPAPLACANLCHSLVGQALDGRVADDAVCASVVDACMRTRGAVVNDHVASAS